MGKPFGSLSHESLKFGEIFPIKHIFIYHQKKSFKVGHWPTSVEKTHLKPINSWFQPQARYRGVDGVEHGAGDLRASFCAAGAPEMEFLYLHPGAPWDWKTYLHEYHKF